jgi:hypothetical protein
MIAFYNMQKFFELISCATALPPFVFLLKDGKNFLTPTGNV